MGDLFRRIYYLLQRRQLEQELQNDMAVHREMLGQEHKKDFGNPLLLQEQSHEAWNWGWLECLLQDLRYGSRMLRKNAGYTLVALLRGRGAVCRVPDRQLHPGAARDQGRSHDRVAR